MRSGATNERGRDEIGANSPGPSGFHAAVSQFVGRLARNTATRCTALLLAQHAE